MDNNGLLYYIKELADADGLRHNYWIQYNTKNAKEVFSTGNDEIYELLGIPVATDDLGLGYGVMGFEMACINKNNSVEWKEKIENIVVDTINQNLYLCNSKNDNNSNTLIVDIYKKNGVFSEQLELTIPVEVSKKYDIGNWSIINIIKGNNLNILGINPLYFNRQANKYQYRKILLEYDLSDNKIIAIDENPSLLYKKGYRIQRANDWQIDRNGNVYIPLLGPQSFYVIKVNFLK
jgi:hypothetical protein